MFTSVAPIRQIQSGTLQFSAELFREVCVCPVPRQLFLTASLWGVKEPEVVKRMIKMMAQQPGKRFLLELEMGLKSQA